MYQWQGEKVKVKFGFCTPSENIEKPLWWYNYEVNCLREAIPAIMINNDFVISNHFGIGVYKLMQGGWPNCTHFSLPKDLFMEDRAQCFRIVDFNLDEYSEHEAKRLKWQKENFPIEFEKMEALRRIIIKSK
ncbi:MAG: hypothetical protein WC827_03705 [Candidatus Paceibacterota bacterium]|jgi:hypothetical protein